MFLGTDAKVVRIKSGYIFKLNGNGRRWSPRYLVIYPGYFCYYKNSPVSKNRIIEGWGEGNNLA